MDVKKNKKEIMLIILYTVTLIFAFIHIKEIFNFVMYIIAISSPFIIGLMIAFVLNVLLNLVENKLLKKLGKKHKKLKRPLSLTITFLIIIGVISLVLGLVIPQMNNTVSIFKDNIDNYKTETLNFLNNIGIDKNKIEDINNYMVDVKNNVTKYVQNNSQSIMKQTLGVASSILGTFTTITLAIIFACYVLAKKEDLSRQIKEIMKAYLSKKDQKKITDIANLSSNVFGNFISGQFTEAIIIGVLCFIGMLILQIPYAPTISVLVGFTALIPIFGAFIGTGIGAFLIFMIDPLKALIFIIFIIVLQQVEGNFIYPKVVGKSVGLPSIWVMVAVTFGASIYGIFGMIISVPLASVLYSIIRTNVKEKIRE